MLENKLATRKDDDLILNIWERSVRATHQFLEPGDLAFYKQQIPKFFDQVEVNLWFLGDEPIGFSGTSEDMIEMLFIEPSQIGKGFGHDILNWLIEQKQMTKVDVNEQNKHGTAFYVKHGFNIKDSSPQDGFCKPYPILHLER